MSLAAKGRVMSEETKAKLRIANPGKHHSLESRQKMSRAKKEKRLISSIEIEYQKIIVCTGIL